MSKNQYGLFLPLLAALCFIAALIGWSLEAYHHFAAPKGDITATSTTTEESTELYIYCPGNKCTPVEPHDMSIVYMMPSDKELCVAGGKFPVCFVSDPLKGCSAYNGDGTCKEALYNTPTSTFNFTAPAVDHSQDVKTWSCEFEQLTSNNRYISWYRKPPYGEGIAWIYSSTGTWPIGVYFVNDEQPLGSSTLSFRPFSYDGSDQVKTIGTQTPASLGYSDCQLIN